MTKRLQRENYKTRLDIAKKLLINCKIYTEGRDVLPKEYLKEIDYVINNF